MSSDLDVILIPKSTAHQTLACLEALIELHRRQPAAAGTSGVIAELIEFREAVSLGMRSSRDRTARVAAATLARISDRLTACAKAELGPEELQAAMWRIAGRLHRWVAEGTAAPPLTRTSSPRAPQPR
ncbi:hypothetical protein ACXDF8_14780 [Mycolicibacterium sp. CBM1]